MENKKEKAIYEEPKLVTLMINPTDVITTSDLGTGSDENWEDNTPPQGWV